MSQFEIYSLTLQIIGFIAILVGLYFAHRQLKTLIRSHYDNHDWNRRIETFNAMNDGRLQAHLTELSVTFEISEARHSIPLDKILSELAEKPDIRLSLHFTFNFFEELVIGIDHGVYDEKIVKSTWKSTIIRIDNIFSEYMNYRRNEVQDSAWRNMSSFADRCKSTSEERMTTGTI